MTKHTPEQRAVVLKAFSDLKKSWASEPRTPDPTEEWLLASMKAAHAQLGLWPDSSTKKVRRFVCCGGDFASDVLAYAFDECCKAGSYKTLVPRLDAAVLLPECTFWTTLPSDEKL